MPSLTPRRVVRALLAAGWLCAAPASGATDGDAASYAALQERVVEVSKAVRPWVVHVEAIVKVNDRRNQVTGSGFIASETGHILTNQHVVEKAEKVTVVIPGHKRRVPARIVGTDKQTDIAVLEIDPTAHPRAPAGRDLGKRRSPASGAVGPRRRKPLRTRGDRLPWHRVGQGTQPRHPGSAQRFHPDRRHDRPGIVGRAAGRPGRSRGRHQLPGPRARHRIHDSHRHGAPGHGAAPGGRHRARLAGGHGTTPGSRVGRLSGRRRPDRGGGDERF